MTAPTFARAVAATAATSLLTLGLAGAAQADPPGNNGTVKIAPHGEVDGIPQNTPHVGCRFDVEWYGFDEGEDIVSEVGFEAWAPTRVPMSVDGPSRVFVGGDPASGAGRGSDADGADADNGFDGEATYVLSFEGEPHPQQGFHVRLTIHTPGSRGADVKHKTFWVSECDATTPEEPAGPPEQPEEPEEPEEPTVPGQPEEPQQPHAPEPPAQPGEPEVAGEEAETPQSSTQLLTAGEPAESRGGQVPAGAVAPHQVDAGGAGSTLAPARAHAGPLLALAGLLLAGVAVLLRRQWA